MGLPAGKSACRNTLWVKLGHEWSDRADGPAWCTDGNTATVTASDDKIIPKSEPNLSKPDLEKAHKLSK